MLKTKNNKIFALILVSSVILLLATSATIANVKGATQDAVYIYTTAGGTISANGTALTGGTSYNYDNGTVVSFTATPDSGYTFLSWVYVSSAGSTTSTTNPMVSTISAASALEAMFIPTSNETSTSTETGTSNVFILISAGGETNPAGTNTGYSNYTIGTTNTFTAIPGSGFKFLYWLVTPATGANVYTENPLSLNVTSNTCAIQALFVPTASDVTVPTIDEYSTVATIVITMVLLLAAFGTFAYTRRNKK